MADRLPLNAATAPKRERIPTFKSAGRILAIATCVLVTLAGMFFYTRDISTASYRIKGSVDIKAYVRTADGTVTIRKGNTFHPREQIQFSYSCASQNRFMLMSMDTSGVITVFYPQSGEMSVTLQKGQGIPLPNSIVLDDYLGPEAYYAVFSSRALSVSEVRKRLTVAFRRGGDFKGLETALKPDAAVRCIIISKQQELLKTL